jgi:hypothetical protein
MHHSLSRHAFRIGDGVGDGLETLIPDTSWLSDPTWSTITGNFHIKSDYVAMHDA